MWRAIHSTTISIQHGHFDALMTIDSGAMRRAVGLLVELSSFIGRTFPC